MKDYVPNSEYIDKLRVELLGPMAIAGEFPDVVRRVEKIWADPQREPVIQALFSFAEQSIDPKSSNWFPKTLYELSFEHEALLLRALQHLVTVAESLPARERQSADRAISRLIRLLSKDNAFSVVEPWFEDKRKFRQNVFLRAIRDAGVPDAFARSIVDFYRETHSNEAMKIIDENQNCAQLLSHVDVERRLLEPAMSFSTGSYVYVEREDTYWKMRAISAYLSTGRVMSDEIALSYPREFLWAVGRAESRTSLPQVRNLLNKYQEDPEFIWRIMKTYQKIGTTRDIAEISSLAHTIIQAHEDSYPSG